MSEKNFLNWVGFKGEEKNEEIEIEPVPVKTSGVKTVAAKSASPAPQKSTLTTGSIERIRELESQLAELRSRRDITALSKEEFEILATETAMSLIRTAQQRELKSVQNAERILNESKKNAEAALLSAESKARSSLAAAESRGRKYIEAAEADAADIIASAERESEELLISRKREASSVLSGAKREAERVIQGAATEVTEYRTWLSQVIAEAERLYRIQTQSLDAAESAIAQSRQRLDSAFNKLVDLQRQVSSAITPNGTPAADPKVAARIAAAQAQAETKSATKSKKRTGKSAKAASKRKR